MSQVRILPGAPPDQGKRRHGRRTDAGLQAQAKAKLAEVKACIEDLQVIQTSLQSAIDAGCDDLVVCANSDCCTLPFADIATPTGRTEAGTR